MKKPTKGQVMAVASSVFLLAAAVGSTILTPEQRESILAVLPAVLSLLGL